MINFINSKFHMPPEWHTHERTWMAWPTRKSIWADIDKVKQQYADLAHAIRRFEPVTMIVCSQDEAEAKTLLGSDVEVLVMEIDDSWARDTGPCFILNEAGELGGVDYTFNAWGNKYDPYDKDGDMARNILKHVGASCVSSDLIAEGGALCVDGEGTLLTTESCLLNDNRNIGRSKHSIEKELKRTLGVEKVIWLPGNDYELETNGHIDGIAAFIRPGLVLIEDIPGNHQDAVTSRINNAFMKDQVDAKGRPIELVFIEDGYDAMPEGERFCASYVNFYFTNGGIVMPKYGIASDDRARAIFDDLFPEREIIQVNINDIAKGGGGIHCITQQQPMSSMSLLK